MVSSLRFFALSALALGSSAQAATYNYTGFMWDPVDDLPLKWSIGDGWDDRLDPEYQEQLLNESFGRWVDEAPCAGLSDDPQGVRSGDNGGFSSDYKNVVYWDDPAGDLGSGVLGLTLCRWTQTSVLKTVDGSPIYPAYDCDIAFSADVNFGTTEEVGAASCNSLYSIQGVSTHEIGHLWGLGHSCEDGDPCTDPQKKQATMFWSVDTCNDGQDNLHDWDIGAITQLYGPAASVTVNSAEFPDKDTTFGGVPLEVCFAIEANEAVDVTEWNFGDGNTSTEAAPCNTYTTQGQYTVVAHVEGHTDDCDYYEYDDRNIAYVLACEPPKPAEGFNGLFTYEPSEGLTYQMVNQADTTVYGCVDRVQWDVFKDGGAEPIQSIQAWSPVVEFPEEGSYRVVLNLAGPGGQVAEELTFEVTDVGTGGCSTTRGGLGLAGALVGLGLALSRRRR